MNWGNIMRLAAFLLLAQFLIGFLEGLLVTGGSVLLRLSVGSAISLLTCGGVFAIFAARQLSQPFIHAWIAFAFYLAAGTLMTWALATWIPSPAPIRTALELFVVSCALLVGTAFGSSKRASRQPADA